MLVFGFLIGAGNVAAPFLKISPSARIAAIAGGAAFIDTSDSIFINPALIKLGGMDLQAMLLKHFQSIDAGFLSSKFDVYDRRFACGVIYLRVPDIQRITADQQGGAKIEGTFEARDFAFTFAYAFELKKLLENLNAGVALKVINSTLDDKSATALAIDAGCLYIVNENINAAFSIQNIGTTMKFIEQADPLPALIRLSGAYKIKKSNLSLDIEQYLIDSITYASIGIETSLRDVLKLRTGYKYGYKTSHLGSIAGLNLGFGFHAYGFGFDYAFTPFGNLGDSHRISFLAKF
ncbi:MAG: PorV/PorQ family protein [bacterium]|nr:PorV/PorQ family protein [bacterium]